MSLLNPMAANPSASELTQQALVQHRSGDLPAAEALYRRALQIEPEHCDALHYFGMLSCQAGNLPPAIVLMERAVQLRPDVAFFHGNLGNIYRMAGQRGKAVAAYRRAIQRDAKNAAFRMNFGVMLWEMERFDEALPHLARALALDPRMAEAYIGQGVVFKDLGLLDEALAAFENAALHGQGHMLHAAHNDLLYTLNFHPAYSPAQIFDAHRSWAVHHADPLANGLPPHPPGDDPERRLKIGYVSAFFRDHAVNFFVEPILAAHDKARFEITCYSDVSVPDPVTQRLGALANFWRPVVGLSDEALAARIRADQIDILVDLSGHMGASRLLTFARRPAPVQVTYIGYQATTGLAAMDYRLTDAYVDPPGQTEAWHTETLVRLPETFFCYQPPAEAPPVVDPPCLKRQTVTFGSFNIFAKVTPSTLAVWAKILLRVPGSRLQILVPDSLSLQRRVTSLLAEHGVAAKRLVFILRAPRRKYLEHFQNVDIALDPFPFNGHTTTCDALWMGVPVVTLAGLSYVQRYGGTALMNLGLENLITSTVEAYADTAVHLALDPERLTELRRGLRHRMQTSVLCDAANFTRHLESAYRRMWGTWCGQSAV